MLSDMTNAHLVKKARKDYPATGIAKGESYWWWKFNFRNMIYRSKTQPTRQQLTTSDFLGRVYDIEDSIRGIDSNSDLENQVSEIVSEIESLSEETQEKLDNMPEQLQEASASGQLLSERIDSLSDFQSELEGMDTEVDEQSIRDEVTDKFLSDKGKTLDELNEKDKEELEGKVKEGIDEKRQEIIDELQCIGYGGS